MTQAATSDPAATGTVAETEPGPVEAAHVALAGAVQPAATGHSADRVAVFVEPDAEQQRTLEVGDTIQMLVLPRSTVRRTGGSYAISVDPDSLPADYVSEGGLVAFTVVGLGEDNRYRAVTHASARRVTVPGGTESTWVSPELPPQASAAAARDRLADAPGTTVAATRAAAEAAVRSDLVVRAVSTARMRGDQAATGADSDGAGVKFRNVIGINLSSKRQYSTDNKLLYDVRGRKRMCGSGGRVPALASKVVERFR